MYQNLESADLQFYVLSSIYRQHENIKQKALNSNPNFKKFWKFKPEGKMQH